jgi:hypothetical protein
MPSYLASECLRVPKAGRSPLGKRPRRAARSRVTQSRHKRPTPPSALRSRDHHLDCHFLRHVTDFGIQMNHDSADPKQKRERFQQLTQNPKVKIDKVFVADVRKSKIHPTVNKLTAWRETELSSSTSPARQRSANHLSFARSITHSSPS